MTTEFTAELPIICLECKKHTTICQAPSWSSRKARRSALSASAGCAPCTMQHAV